MKEKERGMDVDNKMEEDRWTEGDSLFTIDQDARAAGGEEPLEKTYVGDGNINMYLCINVGVCEFAYFVVLLGFVFCLFVFLFFFFVFCFFEDLVKARFNAFGQVSTKEMVSKMHF